MASAKAGDGVIGRWPIAAAHVARRGLIPDMIEHRLRRISGNEIDIAVDIGLAIGRARSDCDLTHGYIDSTRLQGRSYAQSLFNRSRHSRNALGVYCAALVPDI